MKTVYEGNVVINGENAKEWKLNSVHPVEEVIAAYRVITGACEAGTRQFCGGERLPEEITIRTAIKMTKGAYGAEKFESFFAKGPAK